MDCCGRYRPQRVCMRKIISACGKNLKNSAFDWKHLNQLKNTNLNAITLFRTFLQPKTQCPKKPHAASIMLRLKATFSKIFFCKMRPAGSTFRLCIVVKYNYKFNRTASPKNSPKTTLCGFDRTASIVGPLNLIFL